MENNHITHLLNSMGVLDVFNISKRVTNTEINNIKNKMIAECSTRYELQELLKEEITSNTDKYMQTHYIPGLFNLKKPVKPTSPMVIPKKKEEESSKNSKKKKFNIKNEKFVKVKYNAENLAKILHENELSKDELLFFIVTLVNSLDLTEEDFDKFHERLNNDDDFEDMEDA